jgi:outer membrane biosynthesis protein TonB
MADAERLMNLMERFDYKSEQYNVCRQILLSHLAKKPNHDEDVTAWTMTGPAPFEFEDLALPAMPPVSEPEPEVTPATTPEPAKPVKAKKRSTPKKKAMPPNETEAQKPLIEKPKRVRKKTTTIKAAQTDNPSA